MRTPHLMTLLLFVFATLMVVSGCKKDDDDGGTFRNEFTFNGETTSLSQGLIEEYGENGNGSFDFDVTLISEGLTVDSDGDFSGVGDFVYLDLNTGSATGLEAGRYTFSADRDVFTMVDGTVGIDLDIDNGTTGEIADVTGGTVDVEIDGNETILTFNLTTASGGNVTGTFRGVLRPI